MQSESQQDDSVDVIKPGQIYEHDEYYIVKVKGFNRMIESIEADGTVNERISVNFDINATEGPLFEDQEPEIVSQEYKQFIQSISPRTE
jgi:hypothetical protein